MIVLGRVVAPYGVKGWVKVRPFGDDPEAWCRMPKWWLAAEAEGGDWQPFEVAAFRPHGSLWVAKFGGVDDRFSAEALEGRYIGAPRDALPATADGEYYWADLVGMAVANEQGESLGHVDALIETGANQVLVVVDTGADGARVERLLPFVGEVVKDVDRAASVVRVSWGKDW